MDDNILLQVRDEMIKRRLFAKGEGLVLGVSGGADSVCLLSVLKELQNEFDLKLTAVHVNHGLRAEESDQDQAFTEGLCRQWNVPVRTFQVNVGELAETSGTSLEEAGREARYAIFNQVLQETGSKYIAVAHHRDDQAETVMLNILRGTGLDGLCGMHPVQGRIIRPLLNLSREQIINYLSDRQISFRTDSSNLSSDYTRNRVRNVLFPAIRDMFKINPVKQIIRMSQLVKEDRDYLDEAAKKTFSEVCFPGPHAIEICLEKIKSMHPALTKRIIRLAWEKIIGTRKNLEQVHVEQILNLCHNGHTGKKIQLPMKAEARIAYDRLVIAKQVPRESNPFCHKVLKEGSTIVPEAKGFLRAEVMPGKEAFEKYGKPAATKEKALTQMFDADLMEGEISVRSRKEGDRIRPHGLGGEKKLKEFFIDQKIPQEARSQLPLLALGNRVAWIVGMRTSDDFRAREDTRNVWVLSWSDLQDGGEKT